MATDAITDLTEQQRRVYQALADLEEDAGAVRPDELAHACDLEPEQVRACLGALVQADLVREIPGGDDLGPRYRVKDNPAG